MSSFSGDPVSHHVGRTDHLDAQQVQEPSISCPLSNTEIQGVLEESFTPPKFSCHSTEQCMKMVVEVMAAVYAQEARDGHIRARLQHREELAVITTKKHAFKMC